MIETTNLTKRYEDGSLAVDHLSLKVAPGEIFCLFGANGAGKTTTINLLLNFIPPTEGTALIEGIDVVREPLRSKDYVAYVSENVMLYGNFTAYQNLDYFTKLAGKRNLTKADYARVMKSVGLQEEAFNVRSKNFSKGMRQKVLISAALLHDPEILLLDEPLSGLDVTTGLVVRDLVRRLAGEQKIVVYSSHVLEVTEKICTRVLILDKGRVVADDSVEKLRSLMNLPSLVEIFSQLVSHEDTDVVAQSLVEVMKS